MGVQAEQERLHREQSVSSPQQAIRSIRHSLRYRRYARKEAYATIYKGFLKGLSEIEE